MMTDGVTWCSGARSALGCDPRPHVHSYNMLMYSRHMQLLSGCGPDSNSQMDPGAR